MIVFSIIVRKDVPISRGMCVHLEVHVYSRGSNPVESRADQPLLMIDPIAPSPDTGVSLEKRMWDEKEDDGVTVKVSCCNFQEGDVEQAERFTDSVLL